MKDYFFANWYWILPAFITLAEAIVRLTPTEKDDSIVNKIKEFFDFIIPNIKSGGGKH